MSELPTIKILKDHENPSNITAEVPGEHKIRELNNEDTGTGTNNTENTGTGINNTENSAVTNTSSEVTGTEYTLSPVITVTKDETTLTKGDMKLQKVTVTEDISRQELENSDHRVTYSEIQTTVHTNKEIITETLSPGEYREAMEVSWEKEMKSQEQKRSRIPKLKFKQTVERIKKEQREKHSKEQKLKEKQPQNIIRRSSIPKLKDAKLVKRQTSLKYDWKLEEPSERENVAEEFDKLYDEIVDNKQKDVDDKILAVKIDDPEKIETKFEEIIHAYDSNDNYLTQTEKLRVSKIPWRKKESERSTRLDSSVDHAKNNSAASLKDGGFKVSATTITTKRFSRGNSMDLGNQRVEVFETIDISNGKDNNVRKETITVKTNDIIPVQSEVSLDNSNEIDIDNNVEDSENLKPAVIAENNYKEVKETTSKEIKTRIPKKPERLKRNISRDLNKRPASLEDRDFVNKEVIKHEELIDDKNKMIQEVIITEKPIKTERILRGISRTFSRDGKSITVSAKSKNDKHSEDSIIPVPESSIQHIKKDVPDPEQNSVIQDPKTSINKEILTTEKIAKESIKIGIPVYTKVTHSFTKGTVQNVEMSKTIEWKPAAEIRTKKYGRSHSENNDVKTKITTKMPSNETKMSDKIARENVITPTKITTISSTTTESQIPEINANNQTSSINIKDNMPINNIETIQQVIDSIPIKSDALQESSNQSIELTKESLQKVVDIEINEPPVEDKGSMKNVTILKGNVNRIISQISVNNNKGESKKEIDVKEDLPKKKSVLSKIALFEGKEPSELNVKIKRCTIDKKVTIFDSTDDNTKARNQVYLPQTKVSTMNTINNEEISKSDNGDEFTKCEKLARNIGNEPVIVDQIWKFQEQDVQNDEVTYRAKVVAITAETADYTSSENPNTNQKYTDTLPVKLEQEVLTTNKLLQKETEVITLPAKIDFVAVENEEDFVKYSPEKVFTKNESQTEMDKLRIGKLDLNFWKKQVEVNKKFVGTGKIEKKKIKPDKHVNIKYTEIEVPNSSVEIDLTPDSTHESLILPGKATRPTNLPGKLDIATYDSLLQVPVVLPETPLTKTDKDNYETEIRYKPVILPSKVTTKIEIFEHFKASQDKNIFVPPVLPENTGLKIKNHKTETEETKAGIEVIITTPRINNFSNNSTPTSLPDQKDLKSNNTSIDWSTRLEQTDYKTQYNKMKSPQVRAEAANFNVNYNIFFPKTESENVNYNIDNKRNSLTVSSEKIDESKTNNDTDFNLRQIDTSTEQTTKIINIHNSTEETTSLSTENDHLNSENISVFSKALLPSEVPEDNKYPDIEVPSDPELVDSEPEIKETKETIIGKLKNKIYFITSQKINQKKAIDNQTPPEITPTTPINTSITEDYNKITNTGDYNGKYDFEIAPTIPINTSILEDYSKITDTRDNNTKHEFERSDSKNNLAAVGNNDFTDINADFESNQELKKAKSLAELDLGDAVKGQVQRMVYRIKSVDFGKLETNKSNKINTKEMPKKSSVLEKIALFEGKAASIQPQRYSKPQRIEKREATTISSRNFASLILSKETPEEVFLKTVEDLSTAKLRYERTEMEYVELGNGVHMPVIALGTAQLDKRLIPHIISAAIDLGFRAIDTAFFYQNEREVGQAIKMKIDDGTVERKDLFIISKLWSTFHRPDLVETACKASLEALGLEYFDLFLIHNPMSFKEGKDIVPRIASVLQFSEYDYLDAWFAMEELLQKGLVRSIGVCNFNSKQIQRVLDKGRIAPVVNQVECHPYLSQDRLQDFCAERNISLNCFGTLGSKGSFEDYRNPSIKPVIDDPLVKVMASALNVSPARLLLSYQLQSGRTVVVKASSSAHLWDVLQALTFRLKQHEVDALNALNRNERIFTFKGMGDTHKNYPFREPF